MSKLSDLEQRIEQIDSTKTGTSEVFLIVCVFVVAAVMFGIPMLNGVFVSKSESAWECVEWKQTGWEYKESYSIYEDWELFISQDGFECVSWNEFEECGYVAVSEPIPAIQTGVTLMPVEWACNKNKFCVVGRVPVKECVKETLVRSS